MLTKTLMNQSVVLEEALSETTGVATGFVFLCSLFHQDTTQIPGWVIPDLSVDR